MKTVCSLLLLVAPLASGCLELPRFSGKDTKPAQDSRRNPTPTAFVPGVTPAPLRKAIMADQVTETNAHAMAEALDEEIAQDEQALSQPAEPALPDTKKP